MRRRIARTCRGECCLVRWLRLVFQRALVCACAVPRRGASMAVTMNKTVCPRRLTSSAAWLSVARQSIDQRMFVLSVGPNTAWGIRWCPSLSCPVWGFASHSGTGGKLCASPIGLEGSIHGCMYRIASGGMHGPMRDNPQRKRSAGCRPSIKNESAGIEDDQTPL